MKDKPKILIIILLSIFTILVIVFSILAVTYVIQRSNSETINTDSPEISEEIDMAVSPQFDAKLVITGLNNPWDIVFLPDGSFVFTQRNNKIYLFKNSEAILLAEPEDTYVRGEGGMLALAIDLEFETNRYIYTCFNSTRDGLDVRVVRWRLNEDNTLNDRVDIVTGLPSNQSGRHSGCQPEFGPDGYLWIGTGDAATGSNPQDPQSLGGKILRIDRDGNPASGNLESPFDPRIFSYGHRNVQGITFLKTTSSLNPVGVSSEHGPGIDDEINMLSKGNFGWDPIPGYNEAVPMTDLNKYPDGIEAVWSSGNPTIAISGITQINGKLWRIWDGAVAVAALRGNQVKILKFEDNKLVELETILTDIGRIRTIQQGPDGNLYVLTDNGSNSDRILRLVPKV